MFSYNSSCRVNPSKNPIVKAPTATPGEEERIQLRLHRAADRITRKIESMLDQILKIVNGI